MASQQQPCDEPASENIVQEASSSSGMLQIFLMNMIILTVSLLSYYGCASYRAISVKIQ